MTCLATPRAASRFGFRWPATDRLAATLQQPDPFSTLSGARDARDQVKLGAGGRSYAVTAVMLSQPSPDAPLRLSFTTSAPPLLDAIYRTGGATAGIPALTLSVQARPEIGSGTPSPG